jgi:PAS domain-containing protein
MKEITSNLANHNDQFITLLNSLDALVYVADMDSYEIVFINNYGKKIWGDITGKICWQSLQTEQNGPCYFCTNKYLLKEDGSPGNVYTWDFQNTVTGKWFHINDRAIRWPDHRIVRVEIAIDITDRKQAERALQKATLDIGERVKELNCLYGISRLIENESNLEELLQGTVDIIPPSWQYPDITCAQIIVDDQVFKTDNFKKTEWMQSQEIIVSGTRVGTVEIFYLKEKPEIAEGPFLKEERDLINAIAGRLGNIIARKRAESDREKLIVKLQKALEEIRTLQGIIPICMHCKQIRDDEGYWHRVETYIEQNSDAKFSHGICPGCLNEIYRGKVK